MFGEAIATYVNFCRGLTCNIACKRLVGGIAMSAYSVMTAGADTRSWYSLPKNVQLAKIAKKGTKLTLNIGGQDYKVEVPQKGNSIVYVRVPATGATPVISVLDL